MKWATRPYIPLDPQTLEDAAADDEQPVVRRRCWRILGRLLIRAEGERGRQSPLRLLLGLRVCWMYHLGFRDYTSTYTGIIV